MKSFLVVYRRTEGQTYLIQLLSNKYNNIMKKNKLGRTNLEVSEIALGGGWVGGLFIDADYKVMERAIELALESGINWIDTAESYSEGVSEKNIGLLLACLKKEKKLFVSSKARLDPQSSETFESQIDRKLDNSLKRLKLDRINLYQLHNKIKIEKAYESLTEGEILSTNGVGDIMLKLKEDGRVENIGITALGDTKPIKNVLKTGCFDTAQIYYNLLNPTAELKEISSWNDQDFSGLIPECEKQNMGILGIRLFAAGLLASHVRHGREIPVTHVIDRKEEERRVKKIFQLAGEKYGNRAQFALRYGLSSNKIQSLIVGMASLEHLENSIQAVKMGPLPDSLLKDISELQKRNFF